MFVGEPKKKYVILKTSVSVPVAPAATSYSKYLNLNDAYDPMGDLSSEQAPFWDTYAAMYEKYKVLKAWGSITFMNETANQAVFVFLKSSNDTAPTTIDDAMGASGARQRLCPANSERATTIRFSTVPSRWFSSDVLNGESGAPTTGSPSSKVYGYIEIESKKSAAPANIVGTINLTMYQKVMFHDLKRVEDA